MSVGDDQPTQVEDSAPRFAESLTAVRLQAGLSVRELSRLTGVPSGTLGGYFSGRHLPPANRPEVLGAVLSACGVDEDDHEVWRERLVRLHRWRRSVAVQRAPYRGLGGFMPDDHDLFFGREQLVHELRTHVEGVGSGVVVVVGASGTGKSSLLRAGLLPALPDGAEHHAWMTEVLTPGEHPAARLQAAIDRLDAHAGHPALLVVDQCEELFTLTPDDDERAAAVDRLVSWAEEPSTAPHVVLIGLRADHYGDVAAHPRLVAALRERQVLVAPMTDDELRRTIEGPAEQVGLRLEWGLTDVILADIRANDVTHVLPHLAHTLESMWEASDRKTLRIRDYKAVGGVTGAVRRSAEQAYADLTPERRQLARGVLLQLVSLAPDGAPGRRARSREELVASRRDVAEVLDYLIARRLVVADETEVSLSHESLIVAWPRLREWLDEDRSDLLLRELLGRQERTWRDHAMDPDLLLRGSLLEAVRQWHPAHGAALTEEETAYLAASETAATAHERERTRRHRRTQQLLAVAVCLALVAALAGVAALQSRSTAATQRDEARSRQLARVATTLREGNVPLANQVALRGFQIAPTRESRSALVDATSLPTMTRRVDPGGPISAAATVTGDLLAFGGSDGEVDLVSVDGHRLTDLSSLSLGNDGASVQTVAFSHDGEVVGVAGGTPTVRLFDVTDPASPVLAEELAVDRTVFDLAFSPDGRWLVAAADEDPAGDGAVLLWEHVDGEWVERDPFLDVAGSVRGLSVGAGGDRVAAATMSGEVHVWSLGPAGLSLTDQVRVGTEATRQFDVAIAPDGRRVAAVGSDRTLRLFPLDPDGRLGEPVELADFGSWVNSVAFTPDGRQIVAGSSDSTLRLWDVPQDETATPVLRTVLPVGAAVTSVTSVDDDRTIVTTTDPASYVWDRGSGVLPLHGDTIFATRASADGGRLVTTPGTADGAAYLWDTSQPRSPTLLGTVRAPESMGVLDGAGAISRSGTTVVAGTSTGYVVSWDVSDPAAPRLLGGARVGESYVDSLAFLDEDRTVVAVSNDGRLATVSLDEPDEVLEGVDLPHAALSVAGTQGRLVAAGGTQGGVSLWDGLALAAGPVASLEVELAVFALDFDGDDAVLAVGGANNQVQLFDVTTPEAPVPVGEPLAGPATFYSVEFSPDGERLAAATLDGSAWVWRRQGDGFDSELVLQSPGTPLNAVGWIDDHHLVAGGQGGHAYLWTTDPAAASEIVCATTGSPATEIEWASHLPGIDYHPPCDGAP